MRTKLIQWTLAFALVAGPLAAAAEPSVFRSPSAGFEVTKPADWVFLSIEQNLANLKAVHSDDPEFAAAVAKYGVTPLLVLTKYPEPFDDLNPSLKVNIRPLGALKGQDPKAILSAITPSLQRAFSDLRIVQAAQDTEVSGLKGAYAKFEYTLKAGGRTFPTTSELWIVPRGDYFFMIGAGTRQDEATGSRAEVQSIVQSVRLAP